MLCRCFTGRSGVEYMFSINFENMKASEKWKLDEGGFNLCVGKD